MPSPDGSTFRHSLTAQTLREPASIYTDALADLERLESGSIFPMVTTYPTLPADGTWTVEVSIITGSSELSAEQSATLAGTLAEFVAATKL